MNAEIQKLEDELAELAGVDLTDVQWDNKASVESVLNAILVVAIAVVGAVQPGFVWPSWTQAVIPIAATVVASIAHLLILRQARLRAAIRTARALKS